MCAESSVGECMGHTPRSSTLIQNAVIPAATIHKRLFTCASKPPRAAYTPSPCPADGPNEQGAGDAGAGPPIRHFVLGGQR